MEEIKLKKIGLKDYHRFYPVFKKSLLTDYFHIPQKRRNFFLRTKWSKEIFKARLSKGAIFIGTVLKGKRIIGYIISSIEPGGISLLRWLWTDKNYRGKGMASQLIDQWKAWAKKRGSHKLRFIAGKVNKEFYLKQGFILEGIRKKDRFKKDFYLFAKFLS